jgi:hypothetical protein
VGHEDDLEAFVLELGAQRDAAVAAHMAERLVGRAPEPRVPGHVHDELTARPKQPSCLGEGLAGMREVLEDVEEAHDGSAAGREGM